MSQNLTIVIEEHFQSLQDRRKVTMNRRYKLIDLLATAICAVICGADSWVAVTEFGKAKEQWFRTFIAITKRYFFS